jgi:hypothetical protein
MCRRLLEEEAICKGMAVRQASETSSEKQETGDSGEDASSVLFWPHQILIMVHTHHLSAVVVGHNNSPRYILCDERRIYVGIKKRVISD